MVKLQSTGVVLSKVKEAPTAETKTFVAKEDGIERKDYETKTFVAEEASIETKEDPAKKGHKSKFFTYSAPAFELTGVKRGIDSVEKASKQSSNKVAGAKFKGAAKQSSNKVAGAKSGSITNQLPKKRQALQ